MRAIQIIPRGRQSRVLRLGIGLSYTEPGGGPVLRDQTSWRKINGVWVNTPRGCAWLLFRRRA